MKMGVGYFSGVGGMSTGASMTIQSTGNINSPIKPGYGHNMTSVKGK